MEPMMIDPLIFEDSIIIDKPVDVTQDNTEIYEPSKSPFESEVQAPALEEE
jgi:hypothetical protein